MTGLPLIYEEGAHLLLRSTVLQQLLPEEELIPSFVFAGCLWELSPWFSLISVEKCFTYWTNGCKLRTRLRTIQRKVEVDKRPDSHPSTLMSCSQMSVYKLNMCISNFPAHRPEWQVSFLSLLSFLAGVWSENDRRRGIHVILQHILLFSQLLLPL